MSHAAEPSSEGSDHTLARLLSTPPAAAAKSLQLCPTLCDLIDGSPPGFPVPEILQARTLEWVAISFSKAWKSKVKVKSLSHVWLFATPWTAAHQAPPSMGFSRQEYWSGVPLPSPQHPSYCAQTRHLISQSLDCLSTKWGLQQPLDCLSIHGGYSSPSTVSAHVGLQQPLDCLSIRGVIAAPSTRDRWED